MTHRTRQAYATAADQYEDELLRIADVQRVLKCSKAHAYQLAYDGVLPVTRIGRMVRVSRKSLLALIERSTQNAV